MRAIEQCIDRLYRLSLAIRRPSVLVQNQVAADYVMQDEEGNPNETEVKSYALTRVKQQFPSAESYLLERIAKAITLRRRYFLYRSSHQSKLSAEGLSSPTEPILPPETERSTVVAVRPILPSAVKKGLIGRLKVSTAPASWTTASNFQQSQFRSPLHYDAISTMSTTLQSSPVQRVLVPVPDPPEIHPGTN